MSYHVGQRLRFAPKGGAVVVRVTGVGNYGTPAPVYDNWLLPVEVVKTENPYYSYGDRLLANIDKLEVR